MPGSVKMALPFILGVGGAYVLNLTVGITDPVFASGGWIPFGLMSALIAGGWYETEKASALRASGKA
jgi:hypothetical protein